MSNTNRFLKVEILRKFHQKASTIHWLSHDRYHQIPFTKKMPDVFVGFLNWESRVMTRWFLFHWKSSPFLVGQGTSTEKPIWFPSVNWHPTRFSGCGARPWTSKNQPTSPTPGRWVGQENGKKSRHTWNIWRLMAGEGPQLSQNYRR